MATSAERKAEIRQANVEFMLDHLRSHPCVDCGEPDIEVLQFDHIEMLNQRRGRVVDFLTGSRARLVAQINLCEVRCANCHVRRTRRQTDTSRHAPVAERDMRLV